MRFTPDQFTALMPRLGRMRPATIEAARAVLVDGRDQAEVARQFQLTRQRIHQIIARVEAAAAGIPTHWVKVECWLPPEVAAKVHVFAVRMATDPSDAEAVARALRPFSNDDGSRWRHETGSGVSDGHQDAEER